MKFVPLTLEHILAVWNKPPPATCRGIAVVDGETLMGVAAIYPDEAHGCQILVSHIMAETRAKIDRLSVRRAVLKASRWIINEAKTWAVPLYVVADPDIPGSRSLVEHLGFTHHEGAIYKWPTSA